MASIRVGSGIPVARFPLVPQVVRRDYSRQHGFHVVVQTIIVGVGRRALTSGGWLEWTADGIGQVSRVTQPNRRQNPGTDQQCSSAANHDVLPLARCAIDLAWRSWLPFRRGGDKRSVTGGKRP